MRDYLASFEQLFPGSRSAYNGKAFYVWSSGDPHIRGAYSYLKVGQYTAFNGLQGRREGRLHFAGEHTSVNFQGISKARCAADIAAPTRSRPSHPARTQASGSMTWTCIARNASALAARTRWRGSGTGDPVVDEQPEQQREPRIGEDPVAGNPVTACHHRVERRGVRQQDRRGHIGGRLLGDPRLTLPPAGEPLLRPATGSAPSLDMTATDLRGDQT